MTPAAVLGAPMPIPPHALAAIAAFALGSLQLVLPKGTARHRALGRAWVALMAVTAASGLFIHELRSFGPFSPIHLLSLGTLAALVLGLRSARRGDIARHRRIMLLLFLGALLVAGLFTLLPGRRMHAVFFG